MDPNPLILASLLLLVISTSTSAKQLPRQQRYEDDYYYIEETIEEAIFPSFVPSFEPSTTSCCKVGERVAKKGMTCTSSVHLDTLSNSWSEHAGKLMGSKDDHDVPDHIIELLKKSQVCLISDDFLGNFKKCCHYRHNYQRDLKACRRFKGGSERRACRKDVHWRYP